MKVHVLAVAAGGVLAVVPLVRSLDSHAVAGPRIPAVAAESVPAAKPHAAPLEEVARKAAISNGELTQVIKQTCAAACHSEQRKMGSLSLQSFDVAAAAASPANLDVAEKIINKLRTGMMPPPGRRRPGGDTLSVLASTLESIVDKAAALKPEPGVRTFQRLNQAEYGRSIKALLDIDVDAGSWLPLDTKSANFDNIADVQLPSATLLDAYFDAASQISRLAVGDPKASVGSESYKLARLASQWDHAPGAPAGTRGGVSVSHTFVADGEYVIGVSLHAIPTGQLFGSDAPFDEKIEISVDGVRVGIIEVDRWMSQADKENMELKTRPVQLRAGAHRVSAAFIRTFEGPVNDNIAQIGHSIADTQIGSELGITNVAHLRDMTVTGPYNPTGVSETASRRRIFTCRPTTSDEERPCAEKIVSNLGGAAYRRPLQAKDLTGLMAFYDQGRGEGGFELGIRMAIEAILSSPHFIFRMEELPAGARPGQRYAVSPLDLASRLSFFIWGAPPDEALITVGRNGTLSDPNVLAAQTRRLLNDPRAEALATRFAAQWLRLQDVEKVHPDALQFPDFHQQLADAMRRETELFFYGLVRENRPVLDLYSANYTYLNAELARHYGISGVAGAEFRKVNYPDDRRSGLLGHASVLTLTSHANRTSPVLRGKWVMEVLMGSPPPPPPPDVPDLDKTDEAKEGRLLTTRERMEMHRDNASCRSCHQFIDPIGLALDNFDVTGRWRLRENGNPVDSRGDYYDGTPIASPAELKAVLLKRPAPLLRTFTANLMAYALGRRIEYYDMPTVRRIVGAAEAGGYRINDFIIGVVMSDAFRMRRVADAQAAGSGTQ
jgi:hypothetical protein